jgi:hypothetical protein
MAINWPKVLPVLVSIVIILIVAFLRDRSRAAAVILATMPINLPLALWVTFGGDDSSQLVITAFVRSLLWGLAATCLWLIAVYLMVRAGNGLLRAIGAGYLLWGASVAMLFVFGILAIPQK